MEIIVVNTNDIIELCENNFINKIDYKRIRSKLRVCENCGYLIEKNKCKECNRLKRETKFIEKLKCRFDSLTLVSKYINSKSSIKIKCCCGHVFKRVASYILNVKNEPCPICRRNKNNHLISIENEFISKENLLYENIRNKIKDLLCKFDNFKYKFKNIFNLSMDE